MQSVRPQPPCFSVTSSWAGKALLLLVWTLTTTSYAGGGPEGVILVVNSNSADSKQVANHYTKLRNLPASNVVYLDYQGDLEQISGEVFREQILKPVLRAIQQRSLSLQVDTIAYSCDFPWQIDLTKDFNEKLEISAQMKPVASLTGATYMARYVLSKSPVTMTQAANWYFADASNRNTSRCVKLGSAPSRGFRGRYLWTPGGRLTTSPQQANRYFLSTMLGVTTGRGNSVSEVIECLQRAAFADSNPPQGAIYYMKSSGIRSSTRDACFKEAVANLQQLQAEAVVARGETPPAGTRVAGLMTGVAKLDPSGLNIEPGAICEHFTSSGGDLRSTAFQTPLSDWIQAGAAGSCGTVYEPFAVQAKFPLPTIHLHYRRGCSLAEAFYLSVASPYQLLIVGDPLCQPWAERPEIEVEGWPDSESPLAAALPPASSDVSEEAPEVKQDDNPVILNLKPIISPTRGQAASFWELYIDGRLRMRLPSGTPLQGRWSEIGPGWHELRCVGANSDPIESRAALVGQIQVASDPYETEKAPVVKFEPQRLALRLGETLKIYASCPGAEKLVIRQHFRPVGEIQGDSGEIQLSGKVLGHGPVRLQAVAEPSGAASQPVWVVVQ